MAHSTKHARTALSGVLLAAGLLGGLRLAEAQPAKGKGSKATEAKAADTQATSEAKVTQLKMTFVSKDQDVAEMAKVINEKLEAGWKANKLTPSHYVDDYDFLRRASLDIIGRVARPDEIARYMKYPPDQRRSRLIEDLLKHEDYARHWANLWGNWLLTRAGDFGRGKYHDQMTVWLEDQFAQNKPYHEWVGKLMTASGSNAKNGAVNFFLAHLGEPVPAEKRQEQGDYEMVPLTSRITRVFLGTQVQCAQCHAHPFFASLKQESFWGVNAFLRQIRQRGMVMTNNQRMALPDITLTDDVSVNPDANVLFEMRNGKMRYWHAEFLPPPGKERGVKLGPKKTGLERREELARHLVDHEMFTKAIVNRMWGLFFGRGFANPIDDFNDNNQPSNPELLTALADRFKHYNYDLKKLIRWMTHSNAYHLSHVANKTNDKVEHEAQFSRMVMKALSPEQLFESLMTATQADKGMTPEAKRTQRNEWLGQLITNFGDDEGNEVTFNGTIVQALLMMNGKNINDAIASPKGTVATAMATKGTGVAVVRDLYLAALNRPPRKAELADVLRKIQLRPGFRDSAKAQYEDLFWALLNSNEFIINH
ncbi:MAG: DUF1553 domain-containing protein [Gemmataceae bacterium]